MPNVLTTLSVARKTAIPLLTRSSEEATAGVRRVGIVAIATMIVAAA